MQAVGEDYGADLFDLVWLGVGAVFLQIYFIRHAHLPEYEVAALGTCFETQPLQQEAEFVETDSGVGFRTQDFFQQLSMLAHVEDSIPASWDK
ncbi:MAG: hypothetical protein SV422_09770 [Pseudomonadota bacterium]|nr:hypothetical protein [Pseudomonadota bacterium]